LAPSAEAEAPQAVVFSPPGFAVGSQSMLSAKAGDRVQTLRAMTIAATRDGRRKLGLNILKPIWTETLYF
jgi:hypothetical protein